MSLRDYLVDGPTATAAPATRGVKGVIREALYREVSSQRIAQIVQLGRARARGELAALVDQVMKLEGYGGLPQAEHDRIIEEMLDMILGLGPIEPLLADPSVTEVMVNGHEHVFYERDGFIHPFDDGFSSEEQLRLVVDRIVAPLGRRVDEQQPIVDARLPEGHRVNAVIPPLALDGTALTIRKFREVSYSLADMVHMGSMSWEIAWLLSWAVRSRRNMAVSGGTGSGKTTLLNALAREIPHSERIITIEDSAELRFDTHPQVVRLEARQANSEGCGQVTIRQLVTNALRMRPDRIIVGECRGPEALDMLQAMTTGHDGSLTTLHANSPSEVMARLSMMVRFGLELPVPVIESQIVAALDLIVQQDRMSDGSRRLTQVAMRAERGAAEPYTPLVEWDRRLGAYVWHASPQWVAELPMRGLAKEEEVRQWEQSVQRCSA